MFKNCIAPFWAVLAGFLLFSSCSKDKETIEKLKIETDTVFVRTVDTTAGLVSYNIIVADGGQLQGNFGGRVGSAGVGGAKITLSSGGQVHSQTADETGSVSFTGIQAGFVTVSVTADNFTSCSYIVDLKKDAGSGSQYDNGNARNAATMLAVFPTSGPTMGLLVGTCRVDLDRTNTTDELVPKTLQVVVRATLSATNNLSSFINHTGSGRIISLSYGGYMTQTTIGGGNQPDGLYVFSVPASPKGLLYDITFSDFVAETLFSNQGSTPDRRNILYRFEPGVAGSKVVSGQERRESITFLQH